MAATFPTDDPTVERLRHLCTELDLQTAQAAELREAVTNGILRAETDQQLDPSIQTPPRHLE